MDRFHLTPAQILKLTDRQIHDVYFHNRDKEGAIELAAPEVKGTPEEDTRPKTAEQVIFDLFRLKCTGLISQENYEQLKREAAEKYPTAAEVEAKAQAEASNGSSETRIVG